MNQNRVTLGATEDGRQFPQFNGKLLSWTLELTYTDEIAGFPKLRTVIRALKEYRPEQLERERREILRASFDRMFGHNAKKVLAVIEEEICAEEN